MTTPCPAELRERATIVRPQSRHVVARPARRVVGERRVLPRRDARGRVAHLHQVVLVGLVEGVEHLVGVRVRGLGVGVRGRGRVRGRIRKRVRGRGRVRARIRVRG